MYVYFLRAGKSRKGPIKIGIAKNIEKRIATLQTGNHLVLYLEGCIKCDSYAQAYSLEQMLHRVFKGHNIRNEWFRGNLDMKRIENMNMRESTSIEWVEPEEPESEEFDPEILYFVRGV